MKFTDRLAQPPEPKAREKREPTNALTMREREILALLGEGLVYEEIAQRVQLKASTVRTHLHNIYAKLGVPDRAQAVIVATRRGIIAPPQDDLSLWERTARGPVIDRAPERRREEILRDKRMAMDMALAEEDLPRPFLAPSDADPSMDVEGWGTGTPRVMGGLADLLIAINLKDLPSSEEGLTEAFQAAMGPDGFDRYGKLIRLAAIAVKCSARARILGE